MIRLISALILSLILSAGSLTAQHYVGVKGGWGGGSARFKPNQESGIEWGLPSGGVSYKFYSDVKYVGAVQFDLQYLGRGYTYDIKRLSDTSLHRTIRSIELPFMWQPHAYVFNRNARVFINLGVNLTYNIDSKYYYKSKEKGIYEEGDYPLVLVKDNKWGYGLLGGAGISVFANRFEFTLEGRYYFGYSDIVKNKTLYSNPNRPPQELNPLRSPLDNINISMSIYYRLGKDGIRSAPSKAVAQKLMLIEEKRILKKENK